MSKHRYTAEIATIERYLSISKSHAQSIGWQPSGSQPCVAKSNVDRAYPVESNAFGPLAAKPTASETCFTVSEGLGSLANISKGFRFQGRNQPGVAT